jgi:hypothetical protein
MIVGLKQPVMAGLVPAIQVFDLTALKSWMPATSAGMTIQSDFVMLKGKIYPGDQLLRSVWTSITSCHCPPRLAQTLAAR